MLIFHRMKGQSWQLAAGVCEIFGRGFRGGLHVFLFSAVLHGLSVREDVSAESLMVLFFILKLRNQIKKDLGQEILYGKCFK